MFQSCLSNAIFTSNPFTMENEQAKKQCEKLEAIKNNTKSKEAKEAIDKKLQLIGKEVKK